MKRTLVLVVLLGLGAAFVPRADADHRAGYHWRRTSNPFTVKFIDNVSGTWQDAVERAARKWSNKSTVVDIKLVKRSTSASCPKKSGAVRICNGNYGGGWAGLTEISYAAGSGHVLAASVKLNNSAAFAARGVACHEIGHALGLAHRSQSETTSCMTPTVSPSQVRPDAHDLRQVKRIHRHRDGGGSTSAADVVTVKIYTYL